MRCQARSFSTNAAIARAATLGRNVAAEIGKPFDEATYHGAPGVCPICHCDVIVPHATEAECATCAARGRLMMVDGQPRLVVADKGRARSILTLAGKLHHQNEIDSVSGTVLARIGDVPSLRARWDVWDRQVTPPVQG